MVCARFHRRATKHRHHAQSAQNTMLLVLPVPLVVPNVLYPWAILAADPIAKFAIILGLLTASQS